MSGNIVFRALWITLIGLSAWVMPLNGITGQGEVMRLNGNLFAAAVISETRWVVTGDRGKIFLTHDSGKNWRLISCDTKNALASVSFPDKTHGWISGQNGTILHSTNGGETWRPQSSGVSAYLLSVYFFDALNGCASGTDDTVIVTTDKGQVWAKTPFEPLPHQELPDAGKDFTEPLNLYAIVMMAPKHMCVAGDGGRIFISKDTGQTWVDAQSPLYDKAMMEGKVIYALSYDSGTIYAAGVDSTLIFSKDQGLTWHESDTGYSEPDFYSISMINGIGIAVGSGGHVIRTYDHGSTWQHTVVPESVIGEAMSGAGMGLLSSGAPVAIVAGYGGSVVAIQK